MENFSLARVLIQKYTSTEKKDKNSLYSSFNAIFDTEIEEELKVEGEKPKKQQEQQGNKISLQT